MARKKKNEPVELVYSEPVVQPITETIETNYMPYAMSVIVSRAIPEIDGFKPSHRKLLFTMYKMGLLGGNRTKSANVVGATMKLNPHGDAAIYDTMVRLSRGNEALLHPFVDSKGSCTAATWHMPRPDTRRCASIPSAKRYSTGSTATR